MTKLQISTDSVFRYACGDVYKIRAGDMLILQLDEYVSTEMWTKNLENIRLLAELILEKTGVKVPIVLLKPNMKLVQMTEEDLATIGLQRIAEP